MHLSTTPPCQNLSRARFFDADTLYLVSELNKDMGPRFRKLNEAIGTLVCHCFLIQGKETKVRTGPPLTADPAGRV